MQRKRQTAAGSVFLHRIKIAIWSLLFLLLLGGLLYYLFFLPKPVPLIALAVTEYPSPIPPNALAQEDIDHLGKIETRNIAFFEASEEIGGEKKLLSCLRSQLDSAVPGGPGKDVVIIYLSAHGALDDKGQPCLILGDSDPLDSSTWLPVARLLDQIKNHRKLAKSSGTKKLLVLDATRIQARWEMGILYNGFADRLAGVVESANDPTLVVLNSTRGGQKGWHAPELGASVFGFYLTEGLSGKANRDGYGPISMQELYHYVRGNVDRWVTKHRCDRQEPLLIPEDADFPLTHMSNAKTPEAVVVKAPDDWRVRMRNLWIHHSELRQNQCYRIDPMSWAELQHKLLRLEELMFAGKAYESQFETTAGDVESLLERIGRTHLPGDLTAASLPLATQLTDTGNGQTQPDPSAVDRWKQARANPEPKAGVVEPRLGHLAAASAAVEWLGWQDRQPGPADLRDALKFVGDAHRRPGPEVVELHLLRILAAHFDAASLDGAEPLPALGNAIRTRKLAELAAAPSDERAFWWVEPIVDQADEKRRDAEDKLFVGTKLSLAQADELLAGLVGNENQQGPYHRAIELAEAVSEAHRLRDLAWAETPYLAQWLASRLRRGESPKLEETLFRLIARTQDLGAELDTALAQGQWTDPLEETQKDVRTLLDKLDKAYADRCDYLRMEAGEDRQTLREMIDVLAVPLVTGDRRDQLRDKYTRIVSAAAGGGGHDATVPDTDGGPANRRAAEDEPNETRYLRRLTQWDRHPALAMLDRSKLKPRHGQLRPVGSFERLKGEGEDGVESDRSDCVKALARQGGEVRQLLLDVRPALSTLVDDTHRSLEAKNPDTPAVTRSGVSQADRLARAAAGLLAARTWDTAEDDPPHLLRKVDRHYQLLWHCRRTLDDFWGPVRPGGPEYFADVAQGYLASARNLCPNAAGFRCGDDDLMRLLEDRRIVAKTGISLKAGPVRLSQDDEFSRHEIDVENSAQLPLGEAAVYIRSGGPGGPLLEVFDADRQEIRRRGIPISGTAPSKKLLHRFRNDAPLQDVLELDAVALYRGHVWYTTFGVGQQGRGDEVVFVKPVYKKPVVKVQGPANQISWVMFILDCSGSMSKRMKFEGKDSTRLNVARDRLETILGKLPEKSYRVGLMLYGHRAGWRDRRGHAIRRRAGAPEGLHPSADVELVLDMGRRRMLDDDLRDEIVKKLAPLEAWGETPLYYALIRALTDFGEVEIPESCPRHIIAISDGVNMQSSGGPPEAVKLRGDVEKMIDRPRYGDTRIDIVGLDMAEARAENPTEVQDLDEIAQQTGGRFHDARDPSSLLAKLEKSLGLVEYCVVPAGKPVPRDVRLMAFGKSWTVEDWDGRAGDYEAILLGLERRPAARFTLDGGESLQLYYNRNENRLEHRRYAPKALRQQVGNLPDPSDPDHRVFIGAHLPSTHDDEVRFSVSVQNDDERLFSPRPKHVWAEIRPVYTHRPEEVPIYHFQDLEFEPDRPVPVLRFRVPRWPEEAKQASIRLWLKFHDDVRPNRIVPVGGTAPSQFEVEGLPGVTFDVQTRRRGEGGDRYRIVVIQNHKPDTDLYSVRVETTPTADRVSHRYIVQSHMVRHVFEYGDLAALQTTQPKIHITSKDRITRDAVTVDKPIVVTLPQR